MRGFTSATAILIRWAAPSLFPFGHGLSYARFDYANLELSRDGLGPDETLDITFDLTNVGDVAAKEVVQLYVNDVESSMHRPDQELRGFDKIELQPGETKRVTLTVDHAAFAVFDSAAGCWVVEAGEFELRLAASSRDVRLSARIMVESDHDFSGAAQAALVDGRIDTSDEAFSTLLGKPIPAPEPVRPFHLNSSVGEIGTTWLGARVKAAIVDRFLLRMGGGDMNAVNRRMFERMADEMPLRSFALFGGSGVDFKRLSVLVALLNGDLASAFKAGLKDADPGF